MSPQITLRTVPCFYYAFFKPVGPDYSVLSSGRHPLATAFSLILTTGNKLNNQRFRGRSEKLWTNYIIFASQTVIIFLVHASATFLDPTSYMTYSTVVTMMVLVIKVAHYSFIRCYKAYCMYCNLYCIQYMWQFVLIIMRIYVQFLRQALLLKRDDLRGVDCGYWGKMLERNIHIHIHIQYTTCSRGGMKTFVSGGTSSAESPARPSSMSLGSN